MSAINLVDTKPSISTCVTAETRSSAPSSFRAAGIPSRLAGGQQVVLLHTLSDARGAQQAAELLTAADVGAEAATPVPGSAWHALGEGRWNASDTSRVQRTICVRFFYGIHSFKPSTLFVVYLFLISPITPLVFKAFHAFKRRVNKY